MRRRPRILLLAGALALGARASGAGVADGYVVRVESTTVYLDWGSHSGVKPGDRFQVYRAGVPLKHPFTGEVLGHTQISVADGSVEKIDEKFSTAHLYQSYLEPKAGDRTRFAEAATSVSESISSTATQTSLIRPLSALTEVWRSEALPDEAVGIALGDVDGDGHVDIVVARKDRIEVCRVVDKQLSIMATYKGRLYKHWLGVETADLTHQGHDDIFATVWQDAYQRPRVVVLRWEKGGLRPVADFEGFVRSTDRADGSKALVWQNLSRTREKSYTPPAFLVSSGTTFKAGAEVALPSRRDDQLFGFVSGDWDGDKAEDLALLERGETLRIYRHGQKAISAGEYGGTQNEFLTGDTDQTESFTPRLRTWTPAQGTPQLIASHNLLEFGIRFIHLRLYKKSEITGLAWTGTAMAPIWQQPIPGYLADFAIGDGLGSAPAQLWVAVGPPGGKTVLIAYRLP